jgi:hypothetical protein
VLAWVEARSDDADPARARLVVLPTLEPIGRSAQAPGKPAHQDVRLAERFEVALHLIDR